MPLKEREILSRLFSSESRKSSENISKNAGKKTNFIKISREEILQSNVPTENIKPSKGIKNTLRKKSYNLQDKENDVLQTGTYSQHEESIEDMFDTETSTTEVPTSSSPPSMVLYSTLNNNSASVELEKCPEVDESGENKDEDQITSELVNGNEEQILPEDSNVNNVEENVSENVAASTTTSEKANPKQKFIAPKKRRQNIQEKKKNQEKSERSYRNKKDHFALKLKPSFIN